MDIRLRFDVTKAATWGAVGAAAAAGAAYALTAISPLHGAIYGLATSIIFSMADRSICIKAYPLMRRSVEYIASSTLALACLKLAGITIAAKTAALLSGAVLVTGVALILLNAALNEQGVARASRA